MSCIQGGPCRSASHSDGTGYNVSFSLITGSRGTGKSEALDECYYAAQNCFGCTLEVCSLFARILPYEAELVRRMLPLCGAFDFPSNWIAPVVLTFIRRGRGNMYIFIDDIHLTMCTLSVISNILHRHPDEEVESRGGVRTIRIVCAGLSTSEVCGFNWQLTIVTREGVCSPVVAPTTPLETTSWAPR
jgi:hypothetical protein